MTNAEESNIRLSKCQACNTFQYPPRVLCCYCLSEQVGPEVVEAVGTVLADTVVHFSLEQELVETLPNHIGLVKLDIGPTLFADLGDNVHMGAKVRLFQQNGNDDRDKFIAVLL